MSRILRWPRGSSVPILAAALALSLTPAAEAGRLLCDGVVIDAGVAFAMSPPGGVDAIDLATGALRWSSSAAAKPLHLADGLLIAQREAVAPGTVELAALAVASGARRHGMTVALPAGVWAGIDDRPGRSFRCHAGGTAGSLSVAWREARLVDNRFAVQAPALDASSEPVMAPAAQGGSMAGAANLDLIGGTASPLGPGDGPVAPLSTPVADTASFLDGVEGRQWRSADGAHVLASVRTASPSEWQKYQWSVYTVAGKLVGTVSHHSATAPFVVAGSTLVFREQPSTRVVDGAAVDAPMRLRGVNLLSGAEVWSRELRDTAFRGPFEP